MLPTDDVLLLGPGPSPVSARVQAALSTPQRSHLDAELVGLLDGIRTRLSRVFRAAPDARTLAISGTGTAAMEAAVANVTEPGRRALVVVSGYFGARLAEMLTRYGAEVVRLDVEWGRAAETDAVAGAIAQGRPDIVAVVHAETSTGVRNPIAEIARAARAVDALVVVDAVTSLGALPLDVAAWDIDVCYACSQKGLGAPAGLSPLMFSPRALARRVACRSFYFDLALLESYWIERKYHHTISAPLVFALAEALAELEDEGLEARWQRHEATHLAFVQALAGIGLSLLPAAADRLWSLNAVRVPAGVDDAAVRAALRRHDRIEIGAGLGPLAGRVWRVGLMGSGSSLANVERVTRALAVALGSRPA